MSCFPSSVMAEDIQGALRDALAGHPSVQAAQADYGQARQDTKMALSEFYPQLSVSTAAGRVFQDNSTSRGLVTDRGSAYSAYGEANIALRQKLFDGLKTWHHANAAKARMNAKEVSVADAQETLALKAASAYIDVLRTRAALILLKKQKEVIDKYEKRIVEMAKDGAADETEVQQAHDVSMIMDGEIADYEGQGVSANAVYMEIVGHMPPEDMVLPDTMNDLIPEQVGDAVKMAIKEHPALKAACLNIDAAREDLSAEKAAYVPEISGELSETKIDKKDVIGGESEDRRAVLRMNWGFSTGGKQEAAIKQKQYRMAQNRAQYDELRREVQRDVMTSYARMQTFREKLEISDDRVSLNEKLLDAYNAQFEGARIRLLGLMRAESQLFNARLERLDNLYNLLGAQYAVLAATGKLTRTVLSESKTAQAQVSPEVTPEPKPEAQGEGASHQR